MRKKQDVIWEQSTLWESVEKWMTKYLNADKHSPASSARSTKRRVRGGCFCQWELKAPTDRSRSDCVHEQVAKRIANVRFTADKHSPASSARSTKRRVRGMLI